MKADKTQNFISVKEIRDGIILQKDNSVTAILIASSINLALKSSDEQMAILSQFQHFLNSLEFPTQIFIQSQKLDIRPYINMMENRQKEQTNELIKIQTREYINFIKSLTEKTNIMTKSFFVTVSYFSSLITTNKGFFKRNTKAEEKKQADTAFAEKKTQLEQRINIIESGLNRTGVRLIRLETEEVVELLYKLYNPGEAEKPVNLI